MSLTHQEAVAQLTSPGQMFELEPWTRPDGGTCQAFRHAPPSMREIFALARAHGDAPFLVYGGERRTFAETFAEVDAFATTLVERYGVQKGDRVAIAMRNFPEWVVAFVAITSIDVARAEEAPGKIAHLSAIEACHSVAGQESYVLKVRVPSTEALEHLLREIRTLANVSTRTTVTSMFEERLKAKPPRICTKSPTVIRPTSRKTAPQLTKTLAPTCTL